MKANEPQPLSDWAALLFRPLVISAMVICFAAGWVMALEEILTNWHGGYLVWVAGVVTIETLVVERHQKLSELAFQEARVVRIRLAELGIIIILVRIGDWVSRGGAAFVQDVQHWIVAPESFFTVGFVLSAIGIGLLWAAAISVAGKIADLEDTGNLWEERDAARAGLESHFLVGALILLALVGAPHITIERSGFGLRQVELTMLTALPVLYVGFGLVLLGQVRFSLLLGMWRREQVQMSEGLEKRWVGWSLALFAIVAALAFLLPAGNTSLGVYLLTALLSILVFLGELLSFVVFLLLSVLLAPCALLSGASPVERPEVPVLPNLVPPAATLGPDWMGSARTATALLVALALLLWVVLTYWRDRRNLRVWQMLRRLVIEIWAFLLGRWGSAAKLVGRVIRRNVDAADPGGLKARASWSERWQARTARERVRRLYLTLLERASIAGYPRQRYKTPNEYLVDLKPHLLENEDELARLTQAFVEARYAQREFQEKDVHLLHRLWQRVQSALRRK